MRIGRLPASRSRSGTLNHVLGLAASSVLIGCGLANVGSTYAAAAATSVSTSAATSTISVMGKSLSGTGQNVAESAENCIGASNTFSLDVRGVIGKTAITLSVAPPGPHPGASRQVTFSEPSTPKSHTWFAVTKKVSFSCSANEVVVSIPTIQLTDSATKSKETLSASLVLDASLQLSGALLRGYSLASPIFELMVSTSVKRSQLNVLLHGAEPNGELIAVQLTKAGLRVGITVQDTMSGVLVGLWHGAKVHGTVSVAGNLLSKVSSMTLKANQSYPFKSPLTVSALVSD